MDSTEKRVLIQLPNASQKFKEFCVDPNLRTLPEVKFREKLLNLAKEGDASAAHNVWHRCKHLSLEEQVKELRKIASEKNPYACSALAFCLSDLKNPECLKWFRIFDLNPTEKDPEFRGNYALAILHLKHPLETEGLKEIWRLLKEWQEVDGKESDRYLGEIYKLLTSTAVRAKEKKFICDLYMWGRAKNDVHIYAGILEAIENTEYADIIIQRTQEVPFVVYKGAGLSNLERFNKLAIAYVTRNAGNKETVKDIVGGNLGGLLQDPVVRDIPKKPENAKYFKNFDLMAPSEKHLISWARLIINNRGHRAKLVDVSDRKLAVQDMASNIKPEVLQDYVVSAFKEIFAIDDD
ncbi:MAG: hypothetical protein K2Y18_01375 [Alphaproteobacteria bacterium]|nr:hypothetical protein [Alphaproteobacteria bacterium]